MATLALLAAAILTRAWLIPMLVETRLAAARPNFAQYTWDVQRMSDGAVLLETFIIRTDTAASLCMVQGASMGSGGGAGGGVPPP